LPQEKAELGAVFALGIFSGFSGRLRRPVACGTPSTGGTDDLELYRGGRFSDLTYVIPVAQDSSAVTLKFAEAWFGPGKPMKRLGNRRFDILGNSQMLAHNFDIFKEAGGREHAVDRTFRNLHPNAQGKWECD
jgi:hypothetical protein